MFVMSFLVFALPVILAPQFAYSNYTCQSGSSGSSVATLAAGQAAKRRLLGGSSASATPDKWVRHMIALRVCTDRCQIG